MSVPPLLHHLPVGVIAIHRDHHPPTAAGDSTIKGGVIQGVKELFKGLEVLQGRLLTNISPIEEGVDANRCHSIFLCLGNHRLEVIDVGVDVSVTE